MSRVAGSARRWSGRAGTVGFVLAALALARAVSTHVPDPTDVYEAAHVVTGSLGEPADLRLVRVVADNPQLSPRMAATSERSFEPTFHQSPGLFLMVDVAYKPLLEDRGLSLAEVVAPDGTTYVPTRPDMRTCIFARLDRTSACSVTVELPPEDVPGAVLRLGASVDERFDDVLEVPLGLSAADVEAGLASTEPVVEINAREVTP